jgi:CBS domain-containing protein
MKWKIRLNVTKVFLPRIKYNHRKFFSSIPVQNEFFSKEENLKAELHSSSSPARPKLRVKDILSKKPSSEWTISDLATVDEAISHLTEKQISASLAIDSEGEVSGLFTARDLLRFMHLIGSNRGYGKDKALNHRIKDFMVPKDKLLICSPNDTALQARQVMSQSKIRHIPVVEGGEVLGIINIKDLADSSFSILDLGGKKGFIQNVTGRKGVPAGTKIRKSDIEDNAIGGLLHQKLEVEVGDFALPHPFKKSHSVGASRRDYGAIELCNDMSLCEGISTYEYTYHTSINANTNTELFTK